MSDDRAVGTKPAPDAVREALKPFADFASRADLMPDDFVITKGSGMARRQLTIGDCRKARDALAPPVPSPDGAGEPVAWPPYIEIPLTFRYKNHRGEVALRRVCPISVRFGTTEWHPEAQWLLRAFDCEKQVEREFAMRDIESAIPPVRADREPWRERWFGSEPQRGWSIMEGREVVAYIGGDETMSAVVTAIVAAHNDEGEPRTPQENADV